VLKGWFSLWQNISDCTEKFSHLQYLRSSLDMSQKWAAPAWLETFGSVTVPDRYRNDTVSISGAGAGAGTGAGAGGGAGETAVAAPALDLLQVSRPGETPAGARSTSTAVPAFGSPLGLPSKTTRAKRARPASTPDTIPAPGSLARRVYDAIVGDPALSSITGNPGDAAERWADPATFPGVDVLAEVKRAGEYAASKPGGYSDGRRFLAKWLTRSADAIAAKPKPAHPPTAPSTITHPPASRSFQPRVIPLPAGHPMLERRATR
jgi:hypothetical protein